MKFPTDAEIQFQSKKLGTLIPVRVRTVIRLYGSPTQKKKGFLGGKLFGLVDRALKQ